MLSGPGEPVAEVRDLELPGPGGAIPVRVFRPEGEPPLGLVVYLHGGGWTIGNLDGFDPLCRALANASGAIVASVDYRLAPEHRFPAAVDDALAATRWLAAHAEELGGDPGRLGDRGRLGGRQPGHGDRAAAARRRRPRLRSRRSSTRSPTAR